VTFNLVGVQETPKATSDIRLDFSSLLGPLFFTWVVQMLLPVFLMQLVYEKEKRWGVCCFWKGGGCRFEVGLGVAGGWGLGPFLFERKCV
jgi:hypothetical protein